MKRIVIITVMSLVVSVSPCLLPAKPLTPDYAAFRGNGPTPSPTPANQICYLDLEYSTYLGGADADQGFGVAIDGGDIYIAGITYSGDFPTVNPYQPGFAGGPKDVFVSKFDSAGSALLYSTYLGGSDDDWCQALAVLNGEAFITGNTVSLDFPTENPYQASHAPQSSTNDVFVSRLSSTGSNLIYSTYLGGSETDDGFGLAVDSSGAYITGKTNSDLFPTVNPYQAGRGGNHDAFVTKLSPSGSELIYSTFLGGPLNDYGMGLAISGGEAYISGQTVSAAFPTENAYQPSLAGSYDSFVSKLGSTGSGLIYSTYLGGAVNEMSFTWVAVEGGEAYVVGTTESSDFPTVNPYQSSLSALNTGVVSKLSSTGSSMVYSTYLGGSGGNEITGISVAGGIAHVVGYTTSVDFPTRNPYQPGYSGGAPDAFVTSFSQSGSFLWFSSYLGGNAEDYGKEIIVAGGDICVAGYTSSYDFPTINPYQSTLNGSYDAFLSKFGRICYLTTPTPTPLATRTPTPTVSPVGPTASVTPTPEVPLIPTPTITPTPSVTPTPTCGPTIEPRIAVLASGDYDGDRTDDIAIFRERTGLWAIRSVSRAYFGVEGDLPVPGDYSGDGRSEIAIYRGSTGLWAVRGLTRFFMASGSVPVPGDYNGDGSCDGGVFTDPPGIWRIKDVSRVYFGNPLDWPRPGDFSGDGTCQIGIFRHSNGLWAIRGYTRAYYGGLYDDWPVPGDYNGDGIDEIVIWRPCTGLWANRQTTRIYYGACIDWPRPADYDGDGTADPGLYREQTGLWAVRWLTRIFYGGIGDIPVTK